MSSNTLEQKRAHKAQQYFRDLLKCLRETGYCDWPFKGMVYRVVANRLIQNTGNLNALVKYPRKRGYKVTPAHLGQKDSKYSLGESSWVPHDDHILGAIIGEVEGPRYYGNI